MTPQLSVRGRIIDPGHSDYDDARQIWKGLDKRPARIVRCADSTDLRRVVDYAARQNLPLAVAGAGHDVAARSMPDGALVAATGALDGVHIDPERRLAHVEPGARWGDVSTAAARYGLATTAASVATVGVAGFALHGGLGWLMRRYGAACDNIHALELVTADGQQHVVDEEHEPDLFWAMRGAGSNFGVVTALTLRLYPIHRVVAGVMLYPAHQAPAVLDAYRTITAHAPDELVTHFYYNGSPDGTHSTGIGLCYSGDPDRLAGILAPLAPLGAPLQDTVRGRDLAELQAVHDASTPRGARYHLRAHYLSELGDEVSEAILAQCRTVTGPFTQIFLEQLGGAVGRVPADATAFGGRDAAYSFLVINGWQSADQDDEQIAWTRGFGDAVRPHAAPGGYPNYLDYDEDHRIPAAFGAAYPRLQTLKRRFDPANMFRFNRNIVAEADHVVH
ncbi:FAD-binding oxidoreductase [Nocardia sp. NPDC019395]|uniref:FAD-binding oxidoreductase n=1 Tax=Nocardia sp. NPDC019395 TaxID=3154686 RepID=UPI0033F9D0D9